MRGYQRKDFERPRLNLVRGFDGRLRAAGDRLERTVPNVEPGPTPSRAVVDPSDEEQVHERPKRARIRVRVPRLSLPRFTRPSKSHVFVGTGAALVLLLGVTSYSVLGRGGQQPTQPSQASSKTKAVLDVTETAGPEFDALLPAGKSIADLGGWARVSPEDKAPVFAFVDMANEVQLNISQQELPESLRVDTAREVEKLAKGFAANEKLVVGEVTAYVGTSIRGPQSVIFARDGLLVLIKSSAVLTAEQWVDYISSLQ